MKEWAEGKCPECSAILVRRRPADYGVCDGEGTHDPCDVPLTPVEYPSIYLSRKITVRLTEDEAFMLEIITSKRRGEIIAWTKAQNPPIWENQEAERIFYEPLSQCTVSGVVRQLISELIKHEKPRLVLKEGVFADRVERGSQAEAIIFDFLKKQGAVIYSFPHPSKLTETELPREIKRLFEHWPFPPNGVANLNGEIFFFDCKFKTEENFIINVTDYKRYHDLSMVAPLRIYFYVESTRKIYYHQVTNPQIFKTERQWNGNLTYMIPKELIKEVAEVS